MIKKTLEDGTILIAYYDDGFYLHVYCACAGEDDEPLSLRETDEETCPGCGKRYGTEFVPTVDVTINGHYEVRF